MVKDFLTKSMFYLSWPGPEQPRTLGGLETDASFPYCFFRYFALNPLFMLQNLYLYGRQCWGISRKIVGMSLNFLLLMSVT